MIIITNFYLSLSQRLQLSLNLPVELEKLICPFYKQIIQPIWTWELDQKSIIQTGFVNQFIQKIRLKRMIHSQIRRGYLTTISVEDQNYPFYNQLCTVLIWLLCQDDDLYDNGYIWITIVPHSCKKVELNYACFDPSHPLLSYNCKCIYTTSDLKSFCTCSVLCHLPQVVCC